MTALHQNISKYSVEENLMEDEIIDTLIMRTMDSLLAFPALLLALAIVAVLGPSSVNAMIAVSIVSIPNFDRISRATKHNI